MAKYPLGVLGPIVGKLGKGKTGKEAHENGAKPTKRKPDSPRQVAHKERFKAYARCAIALRKLAEVGLRDHVKKMPSHNVVTHRLFEAGNRLELLKLSAGAGPIVEDLSASVDSQACTVTVTWTPGAARRVVFLAVLSGDRMYADTADAAMADGQYTFECGASSAKIAIVYAFSTNENHRDVSQTVYYKLP